VAAVGQINVQLEDLVMVRRGFGGRELH
jgi:hypothetical protein